MPQTRFVLKKALEFGLAVVVVVNKIDRPSARPDHVINSTFELFIELNATDEQVSESARGNIYAWDRMRFLNAYICESFIVYFCSVIFK